ncbi:MAG: hypothetical protein ACRENZ_11740 [Thermodesulfobacteriota bacterium]
MQYYYCYKLVMTFIKTKETKTKFNVRKYYSGFCIYELEAEKEGEAYKLAMNMPINEIELLSTLEDWEECNEVEVVTDGAD